MRNAMHYYLKAVLFRAHNSGIRELPPDLKLTLCLSACPGALAVSICCHCTDVYELAYTYFIADASQFAWPLCVDLVKAIVDAGSSAILSSCECKQWR
eukprot:2181-Heterococcus_DN1.PRE.1